MVAFFLQLFAAVRLGFGSLPERAATSLVAVSGFAGVVLVLVGMLSISAGFAKTTRQNGAPDVAIVLRGGSTSELNSGVNQDNVRAIGEAPGVKQDGGGPIVSPEALVVVDVPKRSTGNDSNLPFRGVTERALQIHDRVRIVEGRMFEPGRGEVIVGRQSAAEFAGLEIGREVRWFGFSWTIVGVFEADGGLEESELWTDARTLQTAFERGAYYQSVYVKLESVEAYQGFKDALTKDPRLNVNVQRWSEYLAAQTEAMAVFVNVAGTVIAVLMGLGAIFGAVNAMYTAVSTRLREIATLRALGFGRFAVFVSVMLEAMLLGLAGGVLGSAVAWLVFNGYQASTLNFASFSQVAFTFAVTPELMTLGVAIALLLGFLGGLLPGIRAARLPIAASLREL